MKFTSIVAVVASILITSCQVPPERIVLDERALLYARIDPPPWRDDANENHVIAVLSRGDSVVLVCTEYEKEYAVYEIRLDDGRVGYMFSGTQFHSYEPATPASTDIDPAVRRSSRTARFVQDFPLSTTRRLTPRRTSRMVWDTRCSISRVLVTSGPVL
jgi:hypothetical protein